MKKLGKDFYIRNDIAQISRELLGKVLYTRIGNQMCGGVITETEAYAGLTDRASHAFGGRRTARTEIMYEEGGVSYVYLCYGIHSLFNVITSSINSPDAVLIRAVEPLIGIPEILRRRNFQKLTKNICIGPGKVSQGLGITLELNKESLIGDKIWIEDHGIKYSEDRIKTGPRVGIDYAGEDVNQPYRFWVW